MLYGTQDRDFFPRNFVDRLNYIKELGYDCYEVDGKELVEKTAEIKDAVEKTKVPVTTACNGYRGWIGYFMKERRLNEVTDLKQKLEEQELLFRQHGECLLSDCRHMYHQEVMKVILRQ